MPKRCSVCPLPAHGPGDLCGACVYQWRQIVRSREELRARESAPAIRLVRTGCAGGRVLRSRRNRPGKGA